MPLDHHSAARRRWLADMQQRSTHHLETERQRAIAWLRNESKRGWLLDKKVERLQSPLPR